MFRVALRRRVRKRLDIFVVGKPYVYKRKEKKKRKK